MSVNERYRAQVELLLRCLPSIARVPEFALKGGTAINLFHRDMPRLSVDIDLTWLPVGDRQSAIAGISDRLAMIDREIRRTVPYAQVSVIAGESPKLLVATRQGRIKVEPNTTLRGGLFPPVVSELCAAAQAAFELYMRVNRLGDPDLYGGKLCAALDRQHPRDLFDVMPLLNDGGIATEIRQAFVAYLAGHRRPMAELLAPRPAHIEEIFTHQFAGMTSEPVALDELHAARNELFRWAATSLTEKERRFLLSVKQGDPEWSLLPIQGLSQWPAIQWKLLNVRRMTPKPHRAALEKLRAVLDL